MFPFSIRLVPKGLALLCIVTVTGEAFAQTYTIKTVTRDPVRATRQTNRGFEKARVMQGSFGAPSINDKGEVAYACVLAGDGISSQLTGSIILIKKAKKAKPQVALQTGLTVDNSFLPVHPQADVYSIPDSGWFFRMSRDVALNNKRRIGFAGNLVYTIGTVKRDDGTAVDVDRRGDERSVYGVVFPAGKNNFQNVGLAIYDNYFPEILDRTLSISTSGNVPFIADVNVTPEKRVPGVLHSKAISLNVLYTNPYGIVNPNDYPEFVEGFWYDTTFRLATTENTVIGLPYFTMFQAFSEPIIAKQNRLYLFADINDEGDEWDGIWQGTNADLSPVVVKNTRVPGGGSFTTFDGLIGASPNGKKVAFIGDVRNGALARGVFRIEQDGKGLITIAGVGESAPGTKTAFSNFTLAAANNKGQVAFIGQIRDENGDDRSGVWLTDRNGKGAKLIAIEGGTMKVGKSNKTITKIAFNSVSGMNRRGEVALTVSFTDRTSAVVIAKL